MAGADQVGQAGSSRGRHTGPLTTPRKWGMFRLRRRRPTEEAGGYSCWPLTTGGTARRTRKCGWEAVGSQLKPGPPPQATDGPRLRVYREGPMLSGQASALRPRDRQGTVGPGKQRAGTGSRSWALGRQGREGTRAGRGPASWPGRRQPGRDATGGRVPGQTADTVTLRAPGLISRQARDPRRTTGKPG